MGFILAVRARRGRARLHLVTTRGRPETPWDVYRITLAASLRATLNIKGATMKSVLALTAIALASAATVVLAAPEGQQRRGAMLERLKAADTNADGLISKSEAAALPRLA